MQDNAPVIIAACGLATVCVGIFLVGAFLVVRFLGADLFSFIRGIPGLAKEERGNVNIEAVKNQARDRSGLKARAQSLDFDAAVAQYDNPQGPAQGGTFGAQSAPSGRPRTTSPSAPSGTESGWTTAGGSSVDENTSSDDNPFGDVPRRSLRGSDRTSSNDPRLKKRRRSGNDDEIFGGMLDDDGDGSVDF